jgi:anthranilate synthase component 1
MTTQPAYSEFLELASRGNLVPVYADVMADVLTPVAAYAKLSVAKPAFLFESVVGGEQVSRYSFLGCNPSKVIAVKGNEAVVRHRDGKIETYPAPADPLSLVEEELKSCNPAPPPPGMPRFSGGAVGYLSYEYATCVEPSVSRPEVDSLGLPMLYFLVAESVVIFDHAKQMLRICVHTRPGNDPETAYEKACSEIKDIMEILRSENQLRPVPLKTVEIPETPPPGNFTREEFESLVHRAKEYIQAGDIIQTVLSQRFSYPFKGDSIDLYRALRVVNPSPYMFILEDEEFSIIGASPEVHVRMTGEEALIRPIAGTRPRGQDDEEDRRLEADLLADEKERAEHLMLVDLARNDLGRVCQFGEVRVPEYMIVERYSHVMHIVSEVVGRMQPDKNAFDLMRATFPAGTVSGAPKVRAMQIISELEKLQRNAYAGALGYFGFDGNHDSCIAIRTAMLKDGILSIQSGAGVVADSIPSNEYFETVNKAKGMLKAVKLAEAFSERADSS